MDKNINMAIIKFKTKTVILNFIFINEKFFLKKKKKDYGIDKKIKDLIIPLVDCGATNFKIFNYLKELIRKGEINEDLIPTGE